MADHTISVTNSVNIFGPAPSTKWGANSPYTMTWGTSKWGEGTEDLITRVEKNLTSETLTLANALYFHANKVLENSITPTSETTSEGLQSGIYSYVFVGPTTEAESRSESTYTSQSAGTTTYTSAAATSTTWS